jgi:hypothetical protein
MQLTHLEAVPDRAAIAAFIKERRRHQCPKDAAIAYARRSQGQAFADAVAASYESSSGNGRKAYLAAQRYYRQLMLEAGVKPVRIPNKDAHMKTAVRALISHVDEGQKPSALKAATQLGLDARQTKKLAYNTPLKRDLVQEVVDLRPDSPFVQGLLTDAGMTGIVVAGHVNLSKLANVLTQANQSLSDRVQRLEAAVILLAGEIQAERVGGNSRGNWHAQALALRQQNKTMNQIAHLLGKRPETVKKVLSRARQQEPS